MDRLAATYKHALIDSYPCPSGKYVGNRPIKLRKSNWKERTDVEALERQKVSSCFLLQKILASPPPNILIFYIFSEPYSAEA
jgi:hypothetical protein